MDCKRHGAVLQKGTGRRSGPAWTSEKINAVLRATRFKCGNSCVGAGLARDAGSSVFQLDRGDAIAGKPAPT
ncbi:hypothetical protein CEC48_10270 [Pseudomonas sp. K2I15]|nr:hypothetical protein CEC48_10270 [Pseudomonas sp. K2I15]